MTSLKNRKFKLSDLQAAFADKPASSDVDNGDWFNVSTDLAVDSQVTVRLIEDADESNAFGAFVKTSRHGFEIHGQWKSIVCNKHTHNLPCQLCDESAKFYNEDDRENGRKLYKKDKMLAQVLIVDHDDKDLIGQYKTISFTVPLFKQILEGGLSDLDAPAWDVKDGCDLIIKKTYDGKWNKYTARFARKESPVPADMIDTIRDSQVQLSSLVPDAADDTNINLLLTEYLDSLV